MEHDDTQTGRILSRREILSLFGAAGGALLAGCGITPASPAPGAQPTVPPAPATRVPQPANTSAAPTSTPAFVQALPACIVTPAQAEGPYFVDQQLNRSDIRADPADGSAREGLPLLLTIRILRANATGCAPLAGAVVDIWHCDAQGVYSGVQDRYANTVGQSFLRGYQITDVDGLAQFTTIYPGWYPGRTPHIHFKVRATDAAGRELEFTSQLYFDDAISDRVFAQAPYNRRSGRGTRNENDALFRRNGELLMLALTPTDSGYAGAFDIGLNMG